MLHLLANTEANISPCWLSVTPPRKIHKGVHGNIQAIPCIHSLWEAADHCNFQNRWYLRNKVVPWQECTSLALFNSQGQLSWIFIVAIRNKILVSKANCHPAPIPVEYIFQRNYFWFLASRMDFTIHYWKKNDIEFNLLNVILLRLAGL